MKLAIRRFGICTTGEWPWPFAESETSELANGHGHSPVGKNLNRRMAKVQEWPFVMNLAIRFIWPFVGPDRL